MNTKIHVMNLSRSLIAASVATFLAACAAEPVMPTDAAVAPRAIKEADAGEPQSVNWQRKIELLQAKAAEWELVLTLGGVMFASGKADLKPSASTNLDKLIAFLNQYPDRTVLIEGYTDSVGDELYNQRLSQRRADSVKSYLTGQGIGSRRLSASGVGESDPVGDNDSQSGRQQNRRVEMVISNPPAAAR